MSDERTSSAKFRSVAKRQIARLQSVVSSDGAPSEDAAAPATNEKVEPQTTQEPVFDVNPAIAVVVPARNEGKYLRPCLRSIREQFFNSWECIIIDDGSSDDTRAIADEFASKDSRFRVVSHSRSLGLPTARNTGIELTSAPYLTFLDADDFLYQHSLKSRLNTLLSVDSEDVAGSYCDWQPTAEKQGRKPPKRAAASKPETIAFPQGPECPFIATAPMIRREVIEQLGGFNEELPTAEDYDLWIRILRAGYTFVYTPRIGVAYRQKSSGMVFTDTAMHAQASDKIIASQYVDLSDTDDPPAFAKPLSQYLLDLPRSRRLLRSLALSHAAGDEPGTQEILAMMPESLQLLDGRGLDIRFELNAGLGRAVRAIPALQVPEAKALALQQLQQLVAGNDGGTPRDAPSWSAGKVGNLFNSDRAASRSLSPILEPTTCDEVRDSPVAASDELGVLLVPMARYHALEMLTLSVKLGELGVPSTFLKLADFTDQFVDVLAGTRTLEYETAETLGNFSAVYVMNDWGVTRDVILEARRRGVPSFARVEGVQDYRDVDTGRIRLPYQTADHILAQGQNDMDRLNHRRVSIVGNARLESLRAKPERTGASASGRVVINSNFTYGVLTDTRDAYVESAIRACLDAGFEAVISQHPADLPLPSSLLAYKSDSSMSELLAECDVLISRFSTVPFEAMAIGTPFVYYRPSMEKIDTFSYPNGAYHVAESSLELADCLPAAASALGTYRGISEDFFARQIDCSDVSSDARAAAIVATETGQGRPL